MVNPLFGERLVGAARALLPALAPGSELTVGPIIEGTPSGLDLPAEAPTSLLTKLDGTVSGEILLVLEGGLAEPLRATSTNGLAGAAEPLLEAMLTALGSTSLSLDELSADVGLARADGKPDVCHIAFTGDGVVRALLVFNVVDHQPTPTGYSAPQADLSRIGLLRDVTLAVTVELGRSRITVQELLSLTPGAVVELDREVGSLADLLVNGTLIARGEVVVVDDTYGIRISEIISSSDPDED